MLPGWLVIRGVVRTCACSRVAPCMAHAGGEIAPPNKQPRPHVAGGASGGGGGSEEGGASDGEGSGSSGSEGSSEEGGASEASSSSSEGSDEDERPAQRRRTLPRRAGAAGRSPSQLYLLDIWCYSQEHRMQPSAARRALWRIMTEPHQQRQQ